ncbi:type III secretion system inner rod subunit SctI [Peristeroidobacter soli]|uniref:type III secretion system inner rod subunit SctI n=1 Tax=Peristeroidobacter soli TaxID=2497877 RepID=UPI00101BA787|nr:type III secretion system inner rod subunit SctI [Peristeroidobacter soli]
MAIEFPAALAAQAINTTVPGGPPPAVDAARAAEFRAALDSPMPAGGVAPLDAIGPQEAATAPNAKQAVAPVSIGDAILQGLDHLRHRMKDGWSSAVAHLDPQQGPVSATGLLQFQTGVLQMSFESQLVGTIAGKTSQSIDQLVKMQ